MLSWLILCVGDIDVHMTGRWMHICHVPVFSKIVTNCLCNLQLGCVAALGSECVACELVLYTRVLHNA